MSPELETLDQLLGGDLLLAVIRDLFADEDRFALALFAMLEAGELRLVEADGTDVLNWRWREVLYSKAANIRVAITTAGIKRIT